MPSDPNPSSPSAPPAAADAADVQPDCRLHPFSWLFVLITQLRPFAIPLLLVFFVGRGAWWDVIGIIGAGVAAVYAFVTALAFRYRLAADELIVREGVFDRTERHVPYARIQNIVQRRNPLHRLFDVTELRLESAGGTKPEAVMNVIRTAEAARIEAVLRGRVAPAGGAADTSVAEDDLLALPTREVVRLGLVTNRGLVVVGALLALLSQVQPWEWDHRGLRALARAARELFAAWTPIAAGPLRTAALVITVFVVVALLQKALSTMMALLTFYGFRLRRQGERIATERGLLVRQAASARRDKIQRLLAGEPWLARAMGRRWLWCEVATGAQDEGGDGGRLRWLAPMATPAHVEAVIDAVAPGLTVEGRQWRPLHPRAWRRRLLPSALIWTGACLLVVQWAGPSVAVAWLVGLVWWYHESRRWAATAAWACHDGVIAYRAGWLHRQWTMARLTKGQAVALRRTPFDRRHGMARIAFDTAGAASDGLRLEIPFLPDADARDLFAELRAGVVEDPRT
jgi:putative membrane protein